ncbi:MAG: esterase [Mycobacterium sp.]
MKKTLRRTAAAVLIAAGALGFAGTAHASPANLCDQIDANGMCQFHASGVFDDIDMVFPSNYPDQQAVTGYLDGILGHYQADSGLTDARTSPHALEVTSTRYSTAHTQSVVLDVYQNTGGAHPMEWYRAFNYNTATEQPLTFDMVFNGDAHPAQTLLPLVQAELGRQFGQPVDIAADTGLDVSNYHNFALTDDEVIFFFDKNQLVPATPATQVSVPRSAIQGLLKP